MYVEALQGYVARAHTQATEGKEPDVTEALMRELLLLPRFMDFSDEAGRRVLSSFLRAISWKTWWFFLAADWL